jgi:uncharacterized membrane protein YeiH
MPADSPLLQTLELAGIFVFAISGGLVAVRKHLDIFGVLVLAGTTGLGGGFLRDLLIDATPPGSDSSASPEPSRRSPSGSVRCRPR